MVGYHKAQTEKFILIFKKLKEKIIIMKNKKLIATVASLCLVLVAVVAAVIGVLAAANQFAKTNLKVRYTAAANVYATVAVKGKTELGSYGANPSVQFNTFDQQKTETLELIDGETSDANMVDISEVGGSTNKYALYQFAFTNKNTSYPLEVSMTYTQGITAGQEGNKNVTLFWVYSSDAAYAPTLVWDNKGALTTQVGSLANELSVTSGTELEVYNHAYQADGAAKKGSANAISTEAEAGTTAYIYLVVAVTNINNDSSFSITNAQSSANKLEFHLAGYRAPTV
jgi:hypothetical protein